MNTEEENDMPHVLPAGHDLIAAYDGLEMSDKAEVARNERMDGTLQHMEKTLDSITNIVSESASFKSSTFSTPEDRRTMVIVQGSMLQHLGIVHDALAELRCAIQEIHLSQRQMLRNAAGALVLGIGAYMQLESPEQDLSAPDTLPAIDLINKVLPRDARLFENRHMPRPPESATPHFNNNAADDVMYDANAGLQVSSS